MKIVAISDQHGYLPDIPECDLLLVAGDNCFDTFQRLSARHFPQLQWRWFITDWLTWRHKQPAKHCIVTWGNHDWCGHDHESFEDDKTTIAVDREVGYEGLRIWVSPWSNQFMNWAFMKEPKELVEVYEKIPEGIDIIVSHQPPIDTNTMIYDFDLKRKIDVGSKELAEAIDRVKPRIVICGHIHVANGHYVRGTTDIYNATIVDEQYRNVHDPTEILFSKDL